MQLLFKIFYYFFFCRKLKKKLVCKLLPRKLLFFVFRITTYPNDFLIKPICIDILLIFILSVLKYNIKPELNKVVVISNKKKIIYFIIIILYIYY